MATLVGKQAKFTNALKELVELEYDIVEAYEAAINRLKDAKYKEKFKEFEQVHREAIKKLSQGFLDRGEPISPGPSLINRWLTQGKVVLGNLLGDEKILAAMKMNEDDVHTAYIRLNGRDDKWENIEETLRFGLEQVQGLIHWFEEASQSQ